MDTQNDLSAPENFITSPHPANSDTAVPYLMGYSPEEYARLMRQATLFDHVTTYLFQQAGLQPGMTVVDLGCGVGDSAFVAREIVGPTGAVTAVDRDPQALALAERRAQERGYANITFRQASIETGDFGTAAQFDAVVGRFFFLYITDADLPRVLTQIRQQLRPQGIVALHESDLQHKMMPMGNTFATLHQLWQVLFAQLAVAPQMSVRLYRALQRHDFTSLNLIQLEQLGGGPDFPGYQYYEDLILGAAPLLKHYGLAQGDDLQNIAQQLRQEALTLDAIVSLKVNGLIWGRTPA